MSDVTLDVENDDVFLIRGEETVEKELKERRLPLPDAAESPNQSIDTETLCTKLRHYHLPKLAEKGYICWESDPFCVQRGPHFEEPAFILERVTESVDEYPERLLNDCQVLQQRDGNDAT